MEGRRKDEWNRGTDNGPEYIVSQFNSTLKSLVIKGPMRTFSSMLLDLVFSPTKVALCVWYQDVDIYSLCGVCNWESLLKCSPVASPLAGYLMPRANILLSNSSGRLIPCRITQGSWSLFWKRHILNSTDERWGGGYIFFWVCAEVRFKERKPHYTLVPSRNAWG